MVSFDITSLLTFMPMDLEKSRAIRAIKKSE